MAEYARAWQLICEKQADDAILALQAIIAKDRSFHRAYKLLVQVCERKGMIDQAEQYFRRLLEQDPTNGWAHYGIAEVYRRKSSMDYSPRAEEPQRKKWEELATEHAVSGLELNPQAYPLYEFLPNWLSRQNAQTRAEIERRIHWDPSSPYASLVAVQVSRGRSYQQAVEEAIIGLERARRTGEPELEAVFHELAGSNQTSVGAGWDRARNHLLEAYQIYERLGDWEAQMDIGIKIIFVDLYLGSLEDALNWCQRHIAYARQLGNCYWEKNYLATLALYHKRNGDLAGALEAFEHARALAEQLEEYGTEERWLRSMGGIHQSMGNVQEAARCYEESGAKAAKIGSRFDEALSYRALGNLYYDAGDYFRAAQYGTESARIFQKINRPHPAGASLGNVGDACAAFGDFESARINYEKSLRSAEMFADMSEQQDNLRRLGELQLRMGKPKAALPYLKRARDLSDQTKYVPYRISILLNLGSAYRELRDNALALENVQEAFKLAGAMAIKPLEAQILAELGVCYLNSGDLDRAERTFVSALDLAEKIGLPDVTVAAHRGLGAVFRIKGQYEKALEHLKNAVGAIEEMRSRIPVTELRSSFVAQNLKAYEEILHLLSLLRRQNAIRGQGSSGDENARLAFAYAERGRARSFLDMLAEAKWEITRDLTPEQIKRRDSLTVESSKAWADLLKDGSQKSRESVKKADSDFSAWERRLTTGNLKYAELRYPEPYTAEKAQAALAGTGAVLLEYALGERRSHLWLVTEKKVLMLSLPRRSEIENQITAYRRLITRHPRSSQDFEGYRINAAQLFAQLLAPASGYLKGIDKLIIVPDGILHYLPFETLIRSDTGKYLIEDFAITYAPSASVFGNLAGTWRIANQAGIKRELLAFADPDFGRNPSTGKTAGRQPLAELVRAVYQQKGIRFTPLPNTRAEVEQISKLYPPDKRKTYLGRAATEAAVKAESLPDYKKVHFATHAIVDENFPARSGVVLSLVNTGAEDGILTIPEIFNLEFKADLIVLSACKTGLGRLVRGEGMVGLTRAFMYAGSPRVVVSLWEVNDLATADFIGMFYRNMKEGNSIALALRAAKLAMIHSTAPAYHHPYFWAPFILSGLF